MEKFKIGCAQDHKAEMKEILHRMHGFDSWTSKKVNTKQKF